MRVHSHSYVVTSSRHNKKLIFPFDSVDEWLTRDKGGLHPHLKLPMKQIEGLVSQFLNRCSHLNRYRGSAPHLVSHG